MKTRYFVSDDYQNNSLAGMELYIDNSVFKFKEYDNSFCEAGSSYELHYITKVEEMELSDFIADGRTKYELNGIRFVVNHISLGNGFIGIKTDHATDGNDLLKPNHVQHGDGTEWAIHSKYSDVGRAYKSHIEDIKLVTTCEQCGKDEVQDKGLCSDCISKLPKIESRKVVDIHKSENGSFSVGSVVNMCKHDEIVYTSNQYVEAIEKEVPDLKDVRNKYDVQIVGKDGVKTTVDVYRVLNAFDVHDAATQHAIKKLLAAGKRGHKDYVQDLKEAIASIELAINEWEQTNV